jgi:hypothetical protein
MNDKEWIETFNKFNKTPNCKKSRTGVKDLRKTRKAYDIIWLRNRNTDYSVELVDWSN